MDPSTRPRPFRLVVGVGSGIRDAWLIFGIVVFLLLGLDGMYRAQAEVRRAFRSDPADDIIAMESGFDSFPEYLDEQGLARNVEWQAYVGFRRTAFSGRYINVDSAGHRVTVQPNSPTDAAQQVLFFGGSTMFGTFQRDEWTIPSVAVRLLAEDGITDVNVTNFGETGYVFTQEVIELILQLRSGVRPTVVVFYDGINDVISLVQNGRSGLPQNVANRQRDFRAGRDLFPWRNRLQDDVGVALATGWVLVQRLQLVQRIRRPLLQEEKRSTPESLVQELLADYVATIEIVESLAAAYGFRPVYIWQPTIHTTTKTLSPYEGRLMEFIESNGPHPEIKRVHELMATNIDSAMSGMVPGRFLNLTCLFAQTTEPVFADAIGHTYERPNLEIVGAFLPVVESLITGGITTYDPPESSSSVVPQCG